MRSGTGPPISGIPFVRRCQLRRLLFVESHCFLRGECVKRFRWRRRWMGPKHGVPRGTAVFRSAGSNETDLPPLFQLSCERLKSWSRDDSLTLDDSPESLSLLDKRLDDWNVDPTHYDKVDLS